MQYIVDNGGSYTDEIEQADILIRGRQKSDKPSKKEGVARNKITLGHDITIMNDDKLQQMIAFYQSI